MIVKMMSNVGEECIYDNVSRIKDLKLVYDGRFRNASYIEYVYPELYLLSGGLELDSTLTGLSLVVLDKETNKCKEIACVFDKCYIMNDDGATIGKIINK